MHKTNSGTRKDDLPSTKEESSYGEVVGELGTYY